DRGLCDAPTIHVRPVGAVQIGDDEPAVPKQEACVPLGDVALRQHQFVTLNPPDIELGGVECLPALSSPFFADDNGERWDFSFGGRVHSRMTLQFPRQRISVNVRSLATPKINTWPTRLARKQRQAIPPHCNRLFGPPKFRVARSQLPQGLASPASGFCSRTSRVTNASSSPARESTSCSEKPFARNSR